MYGDVDMLIDGEWKVMGLTQSACWAGPHYPNGTISPNCAASACGNTPCLYNVYADPTEHNVSCPPPRLAPPHPSLPSPEHIGCLVPVIALPSCR